MFIKGKYRARTKRPLKHIIAVNKRSRNGYRRHIAKKPQRENNCVSQRGRKGEQRYLHPKLYTHTHLHIHIRAYTKKRFSKGTAKAEQREGKEKRAVFL